MRPLALQPTHQTIIQRRHVAVLLGRQTFQPGLARMDDEDLDPHGGAGVHRGEQADRGVLVVHSDAAFDGGGHGDGLADRRHAVGDQFGLAHQTGAEPAGLNAVGRTADVQIDLVITEGPLRSAPPRPTAAGSDPPICRATGCSTASNPSSRSRSHAPPPALSPSPYKATPAPSAPDETPGNADRSSPSWGRWTDYELDSKAFSASFRRLADDVRRRCYALFRRLSPYTKSLLHPFCTQIMASIRKQRSGR